MEKGVKAVFIAIVVSILILTVLLYLEFEKLDIEIEEDFDWLIINNTIPDDTSDDDTDWSKINNTKPILIDPREQTESDDEQIEKSSFSNQTNSFPDKSYSYDDSLINKYGGVIWYGTSYRDGFDALSHLSNYYPINVERRHRPIGNLIGADLVFVGPPLNANQFSESEINELENYVKNGGRLILAVDNDYANCNLHAKCALEITNDLFGFGFTGNIQSGIVVPAQGKSDHPLWTTPNEISSLTKWAEDGYVNEILDPKNVVVLARTSGTTKTPSSISLAKDVAVIVVNENPDFNGGRVLGAGYDMIVDYGEFRMFENVVGFMLEGRNEQNFTSIELFTNSTE